MAKFLYFDIIFCN